MNELQESESKVSKQKEQKEQRLADVEVKSQPIALNLMVSFLNLAQKRGSFTIDESAKIWECIQMFSK